MFDKLNFYKIKLLIKKRYSEHKYFWIIKKINDFIFKKNSFYHFLQPIFTNIVLRNYLALIEKKIFKIIFYHEYKNYFKKKIINDNSQQNDLKVLGITKPFKLDEVVDNKDEIINYFYSQHFFSDKNPNIKLKLNDKKNLKVGYFSYETAINCPKILDIANNEKIIKILSSYFQSPFKLDYVTAFWSFKNESEIEEKTQFFHRDLDNFNFIKMFVYLSDVDTKSGAHQYILKSHNNNYDHKISRSVINIKDLDIKNIKIFNFEGEIGTAILANTFGIHRGMTPIKKDRLMLVFSYSIKNSIYSNKIKLMRDKSLIYQNKNYNKYLNKNFF